MSAVVTTRLAATPLSFGTPAKEGARAIRFSLDFGAQPFYTLDFSDLETRRVLSSVQSVYVDNRNGAAQVTITVNGTDQSVYVDPGASGYYPLLFSKPARCIVASSGGQTISFWALNVQVFGYWPSVPEAGTVQLVSDTAAEASLAILAGTVTAGKVSIVGSVTVGNFPATQPVSGSVSVSNLPATQPVSGSVSVSNLPATQPVSGAVSVSNFPATQAVSGSVADTTLAAVIAAGKVQTQDTAAETSLGTLAGAVSAGKMSVADALLESIISGGALRVSLGGSIQPVRTVTAATDTATLSDYLLECNAASNAITETLPVGLTSLQTAIFVVVKTDATANAVTVAGTINGVSNFVLTSQWDFVKVQWDGVNWKIEAKSVATAAITPASITTTGAVSVAGVSSLKGINLAVRTVTAATDTATVLDSVIRCNAISNAITETLPITPATGTVLRVKKTDSSTNIVTVAGTIDGQNNFVLYCQNSALTVQYNGASWDILAFTPGQWQNWIPAYSAGGSMTVVASGLVEAVFRRIDLSTVEYKVSTSMTFGGTANAQAKFTAPTGTVGASQSQFGSVSPNNGSTWETPAPVWGVASPNIAVFRAGAVWPLGVICPMVLGGTYRLL